MRNGQLDRDELEGLEMLMEKDEVRKQPRIEEEGTHLVMEELINQLLAEKVGPDEEEETDEEGFDGFTEE
jgi:hypothetical protein